MMGGMRTAEKLALGIVLMVLAAIPFPAPAAAAPTLVKAARLFDARAGRIVTPAVVLVEGGKIKAVGSAAAGRPAPR